MLSTLKDVVEFCFEHQCRRDVAGEVAYRDFMEWATIITTAAKRNHLFLVKTDKDKLIGVCVMTERPATKSLFVDEIICIENAFATFINEAFARFPDYSIKGIRGSEIITYTRRDLWRKIHHQQAKLQKKSSKI